MRLATLFAIMSLLQFAGWAQAAIVSNGSMNDGNTGTDYNSFNTVVPTDWSTLSGTPEQLNSPDLFNANTNFGNFAWDASTDGGTFVHGLAEGNSDEGVAQDITGLIINQAYAISFEQSISNRSGFNSAGDLGSWLVTFGGITQSSGTMATPTLSSMFGWQDQTLIFTATATTQQLKFVANNVTGTRVDLGLDGVSIAAVPIPAAIWLFGSGLFGLVGIARRHRKLPPPSRHQQQIRRDQSPLRGFFHRYS